MAPAPAESVTRLSVFDRLLDDDPDSKSEGPLSPWEELRRIKAGLCRDLTALLNTRRGDAPFDAEYVEATNSILMFGVSDFTTRNLKNRVDQDSVRLSIERAIRQFEPRLTRVSVTVLESDSSAPLLRFEISALLRLDSDFEDVLFNASLYRDSRRVTISGADL